MRQKRREITSPLSQNINRIKTGYWRGIYKTVGVRPHATFQLKDVETQCFVLENAEFLGSIISKCRPWSGKNVEKEAEFKKLRRLHNLIAKDDQINRSKTTTTTTKTKTKKTPPLSAKRSFIKIARKMTMFFPKGIVERALYDCMQSERYRGSYVKRNNSQNVEIFLAKIEENLFRIKRTLRVHDEKWWAEISEYLGCTLTYKRVKKHLKKIPHFPREIKYQNTIEKFNETFNQFTHEYKIEEETLTVAEKLKEAFLKNYGKPGFICRNGKVERKIRALLALATKITGKEYAYIKHFVSTPAEATALKKTVKRLKNSLNEILEEEGELIILAT
ncbi:MAG: hypothetical protein Q6356_010830 [Candidatus Wukongarchaeota archaeon]|nr:hypothetical protein [Candidatus Wukongarchaeota archaeon]